jgi:hypothetical protein
MASASGGVRSALSYTVRFCHDRAMSMETLARHVWGMKLTPSLAKGHPAHPASPSRLLENQ